MIREMKSLINLLHRQVESCVPSLHFDEYWPVHVFPNNSIIFSNPFLGLLLLLPTDAESWRTETDSSHPFPPPSPPVPVRRPTVQPRASSTLQALLRLGIQSISQPQTQSLCSTMIVKATHYFPFYYMAAQPERKHEIPPLPKGELRPYQCARQPIALLIRPARQQVDTCVDQCAFKPSQVWCITQQPVTTIKIPVNGNCQFHYHNIVIPQTLFQRPCQWPCYLCIYLFIVSNLFNFIYLTFWCVTLLFFSLC